MDDATVTIQQALRAVQIELKAPKGQHNKFGGYDFRSAEDILEAVKPVLDTHGLTLVMTDAIELIGDRYYVKATATVYDVRGNFIDTSAYAREAEDKKGMDSAQVTGATSSYARKYALNGLFAIDDAKDADSNEHRAQTQKTATISRSSDAPKAPVNASPNKPASDKQIGLIKSLAKRKGKDDDWVAKVLITVSTSAGASEVIDKLNALEDV